MAKHMAGKNQRPYSAEDRARRAAKADPRSADSELTPETLYAMYPKMPMAKTIITMTMGTTGECFRRGLSS